MNSRTKLLENITKNIQKLIKERIDKGFKIFNEEEQNNLVSSYQDKILNKDFKSKKYRVNVGEKDSVQSINNENIIKIYFIVHHSLINFF